MSAAPGPAPAPLALSCGDPAGAGAEIAAAAWDRLRGAAPFALLGDADWIGATGVPVARIDAIEEAPAASAAALPVLHRPLAIPATPGIPAPENAAHIVQSIEDAVALARAGRAGGVVTLPINKKALKDGCGFAHPGHTEFLAALDGRDRSVMMLMGPAMKVVPVTIHIALRDVPDALTGAEIEETARLLHAALRRDFGLTAPRIAVAGLNPHAGEGGVMGREEIEVIAPALDRLRAEGMEIAGPLPADTMFHAPARAKWDAALCMYHDQALIPMKTLDFDRGVNATLGLSFIRTSPDHGTAYDIAGKGLARPDSLIEAIRAAQAMAAARAAHDARTGA
ncbi:4-hydroxythreonine-4-phosphate dehydrogenase PdxA [Rhodovulum sp. DZ06]|uniref:4-hydroxythreonine-4-phosphate dehydrogenase PdxA n=1 Tax=Rhodovulum sp. DZ06 TaxID=3425126 RepID=UPI003D35996B